MAFSQSAYNRQLAGFQSLRRDLATDGPIKRIGSALRLDPRVDEQRQEILRWMTTVLAEVEKTLGDDKKDLTACSTESFVQAMIDAATIGIPIDGRRLADLVPRGGAIQYQINTAGFVYLVGRYYDDANFKTGAVFEGDTFRVWTENGQDHYEHQVKSPFEDDLKKLQGIYVALSYSKGGVHYQKVERLSKSEIDKIKGKAKQNYIWNEWFLERAQTAALKRIAKRQFQTIMGIQEAIAYDNRQNFDMEKKLLPPPSAGTIIDNLNAKLLPPKPTVKEPEKQAEPDITPAAKTHIEDQKQENDTCKICGGTGILEEEADGQRWEEECPACREQKSLF